ncbi:exodeoxyribonuclease VII large subunit [Xylella taiwanensis]|uniref:Exodeoxyribonuclease 7 large subunit n=1 Tax=Xylella taiwanensis TaxID=1444770 RepID=Z9JMC0_9GAMM|nr:exodeoxyribonuclease VII large subunit [Xylella taiwanensis]AXI84528.1 exodeoxyribonuclease [Xylella taiwanensis]EWS79324.1 exodeoxyribonuclease VII large subunit [Xylella taiwanensis]MCD8455429.1 exodeoxyribonuclease VII large subunit [Xylella taiwanensis]MCD8457833.1 exodeoxyribonuclease VII large subunit [Xylella taiwanensis]MCD8459969.1 exodeoxyribonuclease VII large subunit [Xylella taiwanensis]
MQHRDQILTPSQLNTLARDLLESAFPLVWIEGELGHVTRPSSGHLYITLKDTHAQVRCAMFKPQSQWLTFQPREGLRVLARGRMTLYEARGDYQVVLDHIEEAGEGALRRAFEQLRIRLEAEGLFDAARKQPLPTHPRRIALITSPTGAAVRDIFSVLMRRFPLVEIEVLPSLVQGDTAAAQITNLLRRADTSGRYDAILVARGGGSLEDLWAFNDEQLARTIAAAHTPVISAIGHETDFTLADFAADIRAPTPSVAAELLVPDQRTLQKHLRQLQERLLYLQQHYLDQAIQRTDQLGLRLHARNPQMHLRLLAQRQTEAGRRLQQRIRHVLERAQGQLLNKQTRLYAHNPRQQLERLQGDLQHLNPQEPLQRRLRYEQLRLHGLVRALEAVNPLATVARGYALMSRTDNNELVRDSTQVTTGDLLDAKLAHGQLRVRVEFSSN